MASTQLQDHAEVATFHQDIQALPMIYENLSMHSLGTKVLLITHIITLDP